MSDRDIRAELGIPADRSAGDMAGLLTLVAGLAERLASDAENADHEWSQASAVGHHYAASWLRWLISELEDDTDE
ncbi:hypothetical protein [Bacillus mobilis]